MNTILVDLLILGALGFVGLGQVSKGKDSAAARRAEESLKAAVESVMTVRKELIMLAAVARNEGNKLREAVEKIADAAGDAESKRKSLVFEVTRADSLVQELEAGTASADRACSLLSETVASAAEAKRGIEEVQEAGLDVDEAPSARRRSRNVIRLVKG